MYKLVDPLEVFHQLVGVARPPDPTGAAAIAAQQRVARNKSVLDAVLENAQRTRARLGASDQRRMDEFLDSVRAVERRVVGSSTAMGGMACSLTPSFEMPTVEQSAAAPRHTTAGYSKESHADAMNELIALAFECDLTRVISYMLEDERSEFTYDHVQERAFTAETLDAQRVAACPEYHSAQHEGGDRFASITWWNVGKVAELCRRLDVIKEGQRCERPRQHGGLPGLVHARRRSLGNQLPVALIGGGNLGLRTDQHVVLDGRPLRDLYFTLMNDVYGLNATDFGENLTGAPPARSISYSTDRRRGAPVVVFRRFDRPG